jgi:hypothetical protein
MSVEALTALLEMLGAEVPEADLLSELRRFVRPMRPTHRGSTSSPASY